MKKIKKYTPAQRKAARAAVERAILRCCRATVGQWRAAASDDDTWIDRVRATERAGLALLRAQGKLAAMSPRRRA